MKKIYRGLSIFDGKHSRFGGHSQWLHKLSKLDYFSLDFGLWKPYYDHYWYDGQHHILSLIFIRFMWGGKPFKDIPN